MSEQAILVGYHAGCADGFGAAWAAWGHFGDQARYQPLQYGGTLPDLTGIARLYLLDFSYPRATLEALAAQCDVCVIDHHKTAAEALAGFPDTRFDMDKSGAVLAWEEFHRTDVPLLLQYVQDRDLWRWVLPHSREISAMLWSSPMEFITWSALAAELETTTGLHVHTLEGAAILRYMVQQTTMICDQVAWEFVAGISVPAVNATSLWSEVGEELLRRYPEAPFVGAYSFRADGVKRWSLRSRGDCDVSVIAKRMGGGGHAAAAGFEERPA